MAGRTGWEKQDKENWADGTGQTEQDCQDIAARTGLLGQMVRAELGEDRMKRTAGTGVLEQDNRKEQAEQDCHDRTFGTGRPGQDC